MAAAPSDTSPEKGPNKPPTPDVNNAAAVKVATSESDVDAANTEQPNKSGNAYFRIFSYATTFKRSLQLVAFLAAIASRKFDPTIHTTLQCIALTNYLTNKLLLISIKITYKYINFNLLFIYIYSQIYKQLFPKLIQQLFSILEYK